MGLQYENILPKWHLMGIFDKFNVSANTHHGLILVETLITQEKYPRQNLLRFLG